MNAFAARLVLPAAAIVAVSVCATGAPAAQGTERADTAVAETEIRESERAAVVWDLSADEWSRYGELMRGRRGVWTPDADPLLVLGAHARTAAERRRFAEAFVVAEHRRVEGELAFERAVQAAWARLFPGELRIATPRPPAPAERYALVVDRDCAECRRTVRAYLGGGVPVDLHVRGAADDDDLRAWAAAMGVEGAEVLRGRVTVNHGDGSPPGEALAVWARRDGRWEAVQ